MIGTLLYLVLTLYLFVLLGRFILDWVQVLARDWRPSGPMLVVANAVYGATDPLVRPLRRVIPPLRLGGISLDLSFLVLLIAVSIARRLVLALPF